MNKTPSSIVVEENQIYNYITSMISDAILPNQELRSHRFHRNSSYYDILSHLKYGILSAKIRKKIFESKELTREEMAHLSDPLGHPNGYDGVSVAEAITDFDHSRLYPDEDVFDTSCPNSVDILLDRRLRAYRKTDNYYNEFIAEEMIPPSMFVAIDIRLLQNMYVRELLMTDEIKRARVINYYNLLRDLAATMVELEYDIPLREMSVAEVTLDPSKIMKYPTLISKK